MNPLRKMLKEKQIDLHARLMVVLKNRPMPLYKIAKAVGIAYGTLTKFLVDPVNKTLGMKTLLALDKWIEEKERL